MTTFNLRVYGLLLHQNYVLVTDEFRMGMPMTKFPGGGLMYGEGTLDCLKREFIEELGLEIDIKKHFYTTDYFQSAQFFENTQLISIYYLVSCLEPNKIKTALNRAELEHSDGAQIFRWIKLNDLNTDDFTFPIDQKVVEMLKQLITLPPQ